MGYLAVPVALAGAFSIRIDIAPPALKRIAAAGQRVTLCRSVRAVAEARAAAPAGVVAWQAFLPFQTNEVAWTEMFSGFASVGVAPVGGAVVMNAHTAGAMNEGIFTVFSGGHFSAGSESCTGYGIRNAAAGGLMSFGLAQLAAVNGAAGVLAPLNTLPVLSGQTACFLPGNTMCVFLSSCAAAGTVIPVADDAVVLTLGEAGRRWHLGFNAGTDRFYVLG